MVEMPFKIIAILVVIGITLAMLIYIFLTVVSPIMSETQLRSIFAEGCLKYCNEIIQESIQENTHISLIAIRKGEEIAGTRFYEACRRIREDVEFPWHCWNRDCCQFP